MILTMISLRMRMREKELTNKSYKEYKGCA